MSVSYAIQWKKPLFIYVLNRSKNQNEEKTGKLRFYGVVLIILKEEERWQSQ